MTFLISALPWLQAIAAILLVLAILIQQNQGSLGSAFGDSGGEGVFHAKRGAEKKLFIATVILAILFIIISIGTLYFHLRG
jgi:protein translocase SecG subunit